MKGFTASSCIPFMALVACLFLSAGGNLHAAEVVLHRFISEKPDPQVESLLYLAAGTELMQAGLSSARDAESPAYILSAEYSTSDGVLTVRYVLSGRPEGEAPAPPEGEAPAPPEPFTSPGAALADLTFQAALDRTLDARVAEAVRGLLQSAGIAYTPSQDARIEGVFSWPPAQTPSGETAGAAPPVEAQPAIPAEPVHEPAFKAAFDASASTAGVILLGGIAQYTRFGVAATLGAGVSFLGKKWRVGIDARSQFVRPFNNQGVLGGPLSFFTFGPDIQFGIGRTGRLRLTGDISGGAALITASRPEGALTKTRPYADAGLYAGIFLGDSFSIGGDARFMMIFDEEVLVMGVSAAVSLRMEL